MEVLTYVRQPYKVQYLQIRYLNPLLNVVSLTLLQPLCKYPTDHIVLETQEIWDQ